MASSRTNTRPFIIRLDHIRNRCKRNTSISKAYNQDSPSVSSLLLAFHASRSSSSLFASQALVESILDLHLLSYGFAEIQMAIKLSFLSSMLSSTGDRLQGPPLFDEEVLSALVALVLITSRWLSLSEDQLPPIDQGCNADQVRLLIGMRSYVLQTLKQYDADGLTLEKLTMRQNAAKQVNAVEGGGASASTMEQMQAYTKAILLTVELASSLGLPPGLSPLSGQPLHPPSPSLCTPATGYIPRLLSLSNSRSIDVDDEQSVARSAAVGLLVCFIGAVTGSRSLPAKLSFSKFVQVIYESYLQGITARNLYLSLSPSDFQQSGGLIRAVSSQAGDSDINSRLFSTWISIAYITFAQLGLQHPTASSAGDGWAWSGEGDESEALGVDSFVKGALTSAWALRREATSGYSSQDSIDGEDDDRWSDGDSQQQRDETIAITEAEADAEDPDGEGSLLRRWLSQKPEIGSILDAERQREADSLLNENKLRGKELPLLVKVEDEQLAQSSPVIKIIDQQRRLVYEVLDFALAARAATVKR